ncbi:MAG: nucleoside triphosphate pyrophosphatase [Thermoplasmata archaeon]|jgi:septum formation protein|nr:nucleoside triphosphate pyrophosphatase [Thermoplasmata archaeon]
MQVVLASKSPRRAVLLRHLLDGFTIDPVPVDEVAPRGLPVGEALEVIARKKALATSARHPDAMVLGADTVVALGDELVGKARDEAGERERLATLSGATHQVWSGLALAWGGRAVDAGHAASAVRVDRLPKDVVEQYVASRQWEGKAGGYGIQDPLLAPYVRVMAGPWSNVVGLPLAATHALLARNRIPCREPPSEAWLPHQPL